MTFKTPSHWYDPSLPAPWWSRILALGYRAGEALHRRGRRLFPPYKSGVPVICIGNVSAGGTGKTPSAIALMELLQGRAGHKGVFLSRGYGGDNSGPALAGQSDVKSGDEPQILAQTAPCVVAADRAAGAKLAEEHGADFILMDDGLQNYQLYQDIRLAVIDGEAGFGNRALIPAGPLRQPLTYGLESVDGFILIGEDRYNLRRILPPHKPVFEASIKPVPPADLDRERPYFAFAGLGRPQKFYRTLQKDLGLNVVATQDFPDHYRYSEDDVKALQIRAGQYASELITTQKDYVRLAELSDKLAVPIRVIEVKLEFAGEAALTAFIQERWP